MKDVLLFGDSIMRGIVLGPDGRYKISHGIDWSGIEEKLDIKIANYSKMGCTVTKAAPIVKAALSKCGGKEVSAVLEYGGNDTDYDWKMVASKASKDYEPYTPLKDFENALERIIIFLLSENVNVILMTLPPIDAEKYYQRISKSVEIPENLMFFLGDVEIIYRRQEAYSLAITKLAYKYRLPLVDVRTEFLMRKDFKSLICMDGIHPSELGEKVIEDAFIDYFKKDEKELKQAI